MTTFETLLAESGIEPHRWPTLGELMDQDAREIAALTVAPPTCLAIYDPETFEQRMAREYVGRKVDEELARLIASLQAVTMPTIDWMADWTCVCTPKRRDVLGDPLRVNISTIETVSGVVAQITSALGVTDHLTSALSSIPAANIASLAATHEEMGKKVERWC